ncbi:Hypothetical predicted protein [Marmota monax]|uniref:Uncharacterized protein n=1 Tax=Marmota monax TaxID=9995 RepID=A0A5E4BG44_MARMO|nr:Hypothetical predicted protein [Marmota monax]
MLLLLLLGTTDILKSSLIIFVVGGPGCGKETQCKNMATKYGFCHVGLGQLLRQEAQKSTHRGRQIRDMMLQGLLVPSGLILDMISKNMLSHPESRGFLIDGFPRELKQAKEFERIEAQKSTHRGRQIRDMMLQGLLVPSGLILDMISKNMLSHPESRGFLIDGFPRELKQAKEFERIVGRAPDIVIAFDCSMQTMVQRVLHRGQVEHRAEDCEVVMFRHLATYYTLCEPVLTFYQQKKLLRNVG